MFLPLAFGNCKQCISSRRDQPESTNFEFSVIFDEEKEHLMQTASNTPVNVAPTDSPLK